MLELSSWLVIGIIYNISHCYLYKKLNNDEFNFNIRLILSCIIIAIINTVVFVNLDWLLNVVIKYIVMVFMIKYIYNDPIDKIFISTLLIYILFSVGEMIFVIIFIKLLNLDFDFFKFNYIGIIITNIAIFFFAYTIVAFKKIKKFMQEIVKWYINKSIINIIFISVLSIILIFNFIYQNYYNPLYKQNGLLIYIFYVSILIIIIWFLKEKTDNNRLTSDYDQLLDYVKTYEEVIEEKSKNQHEYNNQLILIREMLGTRNKKVREYIDQLLSIENEQSKGNWLTKIKNIPNGGLKGLIHYKIVEMQKKKIKLYIDINENVNNKKTNKYLRDNLNDISKIIGVYLDNAREAALKSKEKYIIIEAECNKDNLDFSISNTYKEGINPNKIDNAGYSKKGKGRGYELSLVRDIISKRDDVEQYREFNGIYFVQHICLKYKK